MAGILPDIDLTNVKHTASIFRVYKFWSKNSQIAVTHREDGGSTHLTTPVTVYQSTEQYPEGLESLKSLQKHQQLILPFLCRHRPELAA